MRTLAGARRRGTAGPSADYPDRGVPSAGSRIRPAGAAPRSTDKNASGRRPLIERGWDKYPTGFGEGDKSGRYPRNGDWLVRTVKIATVEPGRILRRIGRLGRAERAAVKKAMSGWLG